MVQTSYTSHAVTIGSLEVHPRATVRMTLDTLHWPFSRRTLSAASSLQVGYLAIVWASIIEQRDSYGPHSLSGRTDVLPDHRQL